MLYDYRCTECSTAYSSTVPVDRLEGRCNVCDTVTVWQRVWGFQFRPSMPAHFNRAVGRPISNMAQFRSELSRVSDARTQESVDVCAEIYQATGIRQDPIEHRFAPIDLADREAVGIDASFDEQPR